MLTYARNRSLLDVADEADTASFVSSFRISGRWRGAFVRVADDEVVFRRHRQPTMAETCKPTALIGQSAAPANAGLLPGIEVPQQVLARLNTRLSSPALAPYAIRAALILAVLGVIIHPAVAATFLAGGLGASACAVFTDKRKKAFPLIYDMDTPALARWAALESALRTIENSDQVLWLRPQDAWWDQREFEVADIMPVPITLKRSRPPFLDTNVRPLCLTTGDLELFFFPDQLYIYRNSQYRTFSYASLEVQLGTTILSDIVRPPDDAVCIRGARDHDPRKFGFRLAQGKGAVSFGRLDFRTADGICAASLHLSSQHVAREAKALLNSALAAYRRTDINATRQNRHSDSDRRKALESYAFLGLKQGCAREMAIARYRDLAREYHPDVLFHLAIHDRVAAEEKMKKINHAWLQVKLNEGWIA